jgi:predicted nuclease with RNAse H fold
MNSGDELRLEFDALVHPRAKYTRDFVFIGDGWIKEGDFTFRTSQTVLPLPFPGMRRYVQRPGELASETAYRIHPEDWRRYHTRYVSPDQFRSSLWQ